MQAVVKTRPEKGAMEFTEDVPTPTPRPHEVVVRVTSTAICGTDKHIHGWDPSIAGAMKPPVIPGHEFCGDIVELGKDAAALNGELKVGDYVSSEMHVVCGHCYQCRTGQGHICSNTKIYGIHENGSFAQFVRVPASNIVKLSHDYVPKKIGAFLDALGNAVHMTGEVDMSGRTVAILGYGPIGAMAAAIAEFSGASRIYVTDVSEFCIGRAQQWRAALGHRQRAVSVYDVRGDGRRAALEDIRRDSSGGVDIVLEMSGAPTAVNDSLRLARNGGTVLLLGIPKDKSVTIEDYRSDLIFKGLVVRAIIGRKMFETWYRMLALLKAGLKLDHVVTGEFPLSRFSEAMDQFSRGQALKVILYPDQKR